MLGDTQWVLPPSLCLIVHSVLAPVCHQVVLAQVELTQDAKVRFCGINGVEGIFTTSNCAQKNDVCFYPRPISIILIVVIIQIIWD